MVVSVAVVYLKDVWLTGNSGSQMLPHITKEYVSLGKDQKSKLRSKSLQVINAGEGVEKREPSYTVGGNAS